MIFTYPIVMKKSLFLVLALAFAVSGDITSNNKQNSVTEASASVLESDLGALGGQFPEGVEKLLGLPNINEGEEMLQAKCLKNGGNESFSRAMEARSTFENCLTGLFDFQTMKQEINKAKPTGDLDIVFKKYCRKTPSARQCLQQLFEGTAPCLAESEQSQMTVVENMTHSIMNFICYKEGDRIALFIAEGGPECLSSKMDEIQDCVNSTVTSARATLKDKNVTTEDIPEVAFDAEKCGYFTQTQKCVVKVLEECSEPTPANIVGSLFDFVRKSTPCIQYVKASATSSSIMFPVMSFILPLGAIILSKIY